MTDVAADLVIGAFTDEAPWVVDPAAMPWRARVHERREEVRRSLPELTRPRRTPPGLRVVTTVRHLGGALALWALRERRTDAKIAGISRRLRVAAEHLGPTYIKLGQVLSSGEGIFPEELVTEFKKCRDQVRPEPWPVVERVLEEELGRRLDTVFSSIEHTPLAAASIAQVHRATLKDGTDVVVKVQRPSVALRVHEDLRVMAWLAPFLVGRIPVAALANPPALVELFAETITEELDFRLEAQNMLDVARSFADLGQRGYVVPRPHPVLVTRRMLVMERLEGFKFEDVVGMRSAGVDTHAVVRTGMVGFMEGALIHGIFHGDLHGGNLFVLPSGKVALLDFGITGRLSEAKRLAFLSLLVGASNNDVTTQLAGLRDLGALPPDTDLAAVIRDLGLDRPPVDPTTMQPDEIVKELQRVVKALLGYGARMPKELMLFVKNMVFLDGAIATLAPDLDLFAEIATISLHFAEKHGERIMGELGLETDEHWQPDLTGVKASFGLDADVEGLTYRELQARRAKIRDNFAAQAGAGPGARRRRRRR
ncbi:MAG: AarF/UbiB family protein [Actinomycetota bacterium]|nr:AarF/ABC1/UbiB kinase family protein [Acidimicrobiia bacterium]MDQ3293962.1 AarF/UbiB family protein [Actinomycetota bacterium]